MPEATAPETIPTPLEDDPLSSLRDRARAAILLAGFVILGVVAGVEWLLVVGALIFMILMHELGHYLTARWAGMKVTEFFIGFGPRIWSFRYKGTEYGIKALWFGAYVRIIGMNNLEEVAPEDEPHTFREQSYPKKLLVLLAGSGMHFLMAFVLLFVVLLIDKTVLGLDEVTPGEDWTLARVVDGSSASDAGLKPGDELVTVNGEPKGRFEDFAQQVAEELKGQRVPVTYLRDGIEDIVTVSIGERLTDRGADGIIGLIEGDQILAVEGLETDGDPSYAEVVEYVDSTQDQLLDVTVLSTATSEKLEIKGVRLVEPVDEVEATVGFFGVAPYYGRQGLNPVMAGVRSAQITPLMVFGVAIATPAVLYKGVVEAFTGTVGVDTDIDDGSVYAAGSPEAIEDQRIKDINTNANASGESRLLSIYGVAKFGVEAFAGDGSGGGDSFEGILNFMILMLLVNVFIGVFNLLPLLPFDGGHVVVATYERIRSIRGRKHRVDAAQLIPVTYVVIAVLVLIGIVVLVRDIIDPVSFEGF